MCKSCETVAVDSIHVWEAQKLGVAPFKCVGCRDLGGVVGKCEACGQAIRYEFAIAGADGSRFVVGSDCVEKTGDWGMVAYVKPLKAEMVKKAAKKAKAEKRKAAFEASLQGPRTITVQRLGENVTFDSPYSDKEALAILPTLESKFAVSLAADLAKWGQLFPRQLNWVHKLVVDATTPKAPKPAAVALDGSWDSIEDLFATAADKLKWPKILFEIDGLKIQLSRAGDRAKVPGSINVTDGGKYGDNRWYGRVVKGEFQPSKDADVDRVAEFLQLFADDPAKVAGEYGKKTGCCCFCGLPLTDKRSLHMGYGAKCAKNFGLPYISIKNFNALPEDVKAQYESKDAGEAVAENAAKGEEGAYDDSLVAFGD